MSHFNKLTPSLLGAQLYINFNFKFRIMKNLSSLLAVLAIFLCASISYGQTFPIRIDCGSTTATTDPNTGIVWEADQYFLPSAEKVYPGHPNLTLSEQFNSTRYSKLPTGSPTFGYNITVPNGNYDLVLHFVEPYFVISGQSGTRIFNVDIENGQHIEQNLDILAEVGPDAIYSQTYPVSITDGNITINFASVNGKDPVINAIEIFQGSTPDNQAPNTPSGLTVNSFDHESANISWNASSDNGGGNVEGYIIYNNGNQIKTTTGTLTTLTGLQANTPHQLSVAAYDNAPTPNVSSPSSQVSFNTENAPSGGGTSNYDPDFALRVNAAGSVFTNEQGNTFIADINPSQYFVGSQNGESPNNISAPYNTERFSTNSSGMSFKATVENGSYRVILHFAELYHGTSRANDPEGIAKRVFDVNIEGGDIELEKFDVFVAAGGAEIPLQVEPYDLVISDGEINIDFTKNAFYPLHHPQVTAIEILGSNFIDPDPTDPTDPPTPGTSLWSQSTVNTNDIFYTTGNVGIGTNAISNYKLAVDGKIRSREVKVDNDNWADYVFFKNYKLPTLEEVEKHIQDKGHLINIPSAAEVEANGVELGEMNKLLLEKIEELTLYVIQQEKRIKSLEQETGIK